MPTTDSPLPSPCPSVVRSEARLELRAHIYDSPPDPRLPLQIVFASAWVMSLRFWRPGYGA